MKKIKYLTFSMILSLFIVSCSSDDDNNEMPPTNLRSELYATNNTNGNVTKYDVSDMNAITSETYLTLSTDSEGIYLDDSNDELTIASRSLLQLNTFADISTADDGVTLNAGLSTSSILISPRDIAVSGNNYVVSDNSDVDGDPNTEDGRFFVFTRTSTGLELRNTITVDFSVWGIEFVGNNLFAIVDKTNQLAVFNNFIATNTTNTSVTASKKIVIQSIVRTHGIAFDNGTMILTDIGDATIDSDGGFHIITDFEAKFNALDNGETLVVQDNQIRVAGSSTFLGNPVAAEYDAESNTVFIAERANGGGRILAFTNVVDGGNIAPTINNTLNGASSLYFYRE
tara:strand:+ start:7452 stop:8477 length:1026 start_codon:yes stop_codon:yes gene_type:complete